MKKILVVGLGTTGCEMAAEFWKVWKMSNLFVPQNNKENYEEEVDVDLRLIDTSINDIETLLKNLKYYKTILTKAQNQIKVCVYNTNPKRMHDLASEKDFEGFLVKTDCFHFEESRDLVKDELWYHGETDVEKLEDNGVNQCRRIGRQVIRQVLDEAGDEIFSPLDKLKEYEAVYICTSGGGGTGAGGVFELVNWLRFRLKNITSIHILYSLVTDYNSDLREIDNVISRTNSIMALMDLFSGASTQNIASPYCDIKEFFFNSEHAPAKIPKLELKSYFLNQRIFIILIDQDKNKYDFYLITILYLLRQILGIRNGSFLEGMRGGSGSKPTYIEAMHSGLYCIDIQDIKIGIEPIIQALFRGILRYVCIYQILHDENEKEEVKELKKDFFNKLMDITKYRKKTEEFFKKLYEDVESEKLEALSYTNIVRIIKSYKDITENYKEFFTVQGSLFSINNKDNQQIKDLSDIEKLLEEIKGDIGTRILNYWEEEQKKKIEMVRDRFKEDIKILCTFLGLLSETKESLDAREFLLGTINKKEIKENIKSKLQKIPKQKISDGVFNILWDILTNKENEFNLHKLISIIKEKDDLLKLKRTLDGLARSMIKNRDVDISSLVKSCGIKWGQFIKENLYEYLYKNNKTPLEYDSLQIIFDQDSYRDEYKYKKDLYSFYGFRDSSLCNQYGMGKLINDKNWEKTSLGFFQFTLKYYKGLSLTSQPLNREENFLISFLNESLRQSIEDMNKIEKEKPYIISNLICSYWPINLYFFLLYYGYDNDKYEEQLKLWSLYDNSLKIDITLPEIINEYKNLTGIEGRMNFVDENKEELILSYLKYIKEKIQYFNIGNFKEFIINDFNDKYYKIDNFRDLKEDDYTILFSLLSDKPETCKILRWYNIFLLLKALVLKNSGLLEE